MSQSLPSPKRLSVCGLCPSQIKPHLSGGPEAAVKNEKPEVLVCTAPSVVVGVSINASKDLPSAELNRKLETNSVNHSKIIELLELGLGPY